MISSATNPKIKYVRKLQADKRFRIQQQVFVIEGSRWFSELMGQIEKPKAVYFTERWQETSAQAAILHKTDAPTQLVAENVMRTMSDTHSPPGILAVLPMVKRPFPTPLTSLLILDGITTPGNMGTMLRTAAAAGINAILLTDGCVDPYNPKVVRGSMGALLRLPVQQASWADIAKLTASLQVFIASAQETKAYTAVNWKRPFALIIGNEANGPSQAAWEIASSGIAIPMHTETESLNAAIAASIILFEAKRQNDK